MKYDDKMVYDGKIVMKDVGIAFLDEDTGRWSESMKIKDVAKWGNPIKMKNVKRSDL